MKIEEMSESELLGYIKNISDKQLKELKKKYIDKYDLKELENMSNDEVSEYVMKFSKKNELKELKELKEFKEKYIDNDLIKIENMSKEDIIEKVMEFSKKMYPEDIYNMSKEERTKKILIKETIRIKEKILQKKLLNGKDFLDKEEKKYVSRVLKEIQKREENKEGKERAFLNILGTWLNGEKDIKKEINLIIIELEKERKIEEAEKLKKENQNKEKVDGFISKYSM